MNNTVLRSTTINGVIVSETNEGFQLNIPSGMTGKDLKKWKWRNRKHLRMFKENKEV